MMLTSVLVPLILMLHVQPITFKLNISPYQKVKVLMLIPLSIQSFLLRKPSKKIFGHSRIFVWDAI